MIFGSFRSVTLQLIILFVASLAMMSLVIVNERALLRTDALTTLETIRIADRVSVIAALLDGINSKDRTDVVSFTQHSSLIAALDNRSWIEADAAQDSRTEDLANLLAVVITRADARDIRVGYFSTAAAPHGIAGIQMARKWQRLELAEPAGTMIDELSRGPAFLISLRLTDGTWANFIAAYAVTLDWWQFEEVALLTILALAIAGLSIWGIRWLTRPFGIFADAATRLGSDVEAPPITYRGPLEVQSAIEAFNAMQLNLQRLIADRTQMLASISHDLRTPITRMRLRTEFINNRAQRDKQLADLSQMEQMISGFLGFAEDDAAAEPAIRIDLAALLHILCEDVSDRGHSVSFASSAPIHCGGRPLALQRCLTNLINNAIRYGERADISIETTMSEIQVHVDDIGPGIARDMQEAVFRPFYRLDESRNIEFGGSGLGLAVARSIARAHGGDVILRNRPTGGLRATLVLPLQSANNGQKSSQPQ